MAIDIIIPSDLWEEDEEAVITNWLIDDGSGVDQGSLIAEIMTAKVQHEINAPASGVVRIAKPVDAVVRKGDCIGRIE